MRISRNQNTILWFILCVAIVGLLLQYGHYFLGVFILLIYLELSLDYCFHRPMRKEIGWLKECVFDPNSVKEHKNQWEFYEFISGRIHDKTIKKNMHRTEIYSTIEKEINDCEKKSSNAYDYESLRFRNTLWFGSTERGVDESVVLYGWREQPVTVTLQIRFKNNKLLSYEYFHLGQ